MRSVETRIARLEKRAGGSDTGVYDFLAGVSEEEIDRRLLQIAAHQELVRQRGSYVGISDPAIDELIAVSTPEERDRWHAELEREVGFTAEECQTLADGRRQEEESTR